jgi:hypothetical protein
MWHGWKGQVVLTAAVEWGPFICCHSFVVVCLPLTVPVHLWLFVRPCQHLLTHPASSCLQRWW